MSEKLSKMVDSLFESKKPVKRERKVEGRKTNQQALQDAVDRVLEREGGTAMLDKERVRRKRSRMFSKEKGPMRNFRMKRRKGDDEEEPELDPDKMR